MIATVVSNDRPYARKVVLQCPTGYRMELDRMVEDFIADGVAYVGVVGVDCALVEDIIDELVVGDGSDSTRYILTASHFEGSLEEAVEFATLLQPPDFAAEIQVVCLTR